MSGHSKWSTIKHAKGAADAKRGAAFTKLSNAITVAVRQNHGVNLAIEKARSANMPKENIQRAIDRATKGAGGNELHEATFEGFGPEGVAIMIETISDNNTRTAQFLRTIFDKHSCSLGTPGAVSYLFTRVGEIEGGTFEQAIELGALDFEDGTTYTKPEDLHKIGEAMGKTGSLVYRPNKDTMISLTDPTKLDELLQAVDELDDVQEIYTNAIL